MSEHFLLIVSWHVGFTSVRSVDVTKEIFAILLKAKYRIFISISNTQTCSDSQMHSLKLPLGWKHMGVIRVSWLLWPLDSRWSQAVARMLFHLWICGGAEKGPGDFIGCAHAGIFTCQGLLLSSIFDLIDSRLLRSVTVEHAHKLD